MHLAEFQHFIGLYVLVIVLMNQHDIRAVRNSILSLYFGSEFPRESSLKSVKKFFSFCLIKWLFFDVRKKM